MYCHATSHYVRREQVEKNDNIKKAYDMYIFAQSQGRENRNWELLEALMVATDKHSDRFVTSELATVAEPLEN